MKNSVNELIKNSMKSYDVRRHLLFVVMIFDCLTL
jgi:hypothetical protein